MDGQSRPRARRAPSAGRGWTSAARVTRQSAPSASAPRQNSRLRSLLPPNARAAGPRVDPQLDPSTQGRTQPWQRVQRRRAAEQLEPREPRRVGTQVSTRRMVRASYHPPMATRIGPADRQTTIGQHPGMERSIAISAPTVGRTRLYSSIVSTAPGRQTRIHHHGDCETSIYILSGVAPTPGVRPASRGASMRPRVTSSTSRRARSTSRPMPRTPSRSSWS
jgi:hypothetical protein